MIYRICAAVLALAISATTVSAAVTAYTNRTAWETALGATPTVDQFVNVIDQAPSITFDSGVVSDNAGGKLNNATENRVFGGEYRNAVDGDGTVSSITNTWTFPSAIRGFGADWSEARQGSLQVTINDGFDDETFLIADTINTSTGRTAGFLGFIGMGDFSRVVISDATNTQDIYRVDDLAFATVIPLPAGLPLMAAGLLALGLIGRRAKRAS